MLTITQKQFNQLIDLLGHAANAEATYRTTAHLNKTDPLLEEGARNSLNRYLEFVAMLYQPQQYPTIYLETFNNKRENYKKHSKNEKSHISHHKQARSQVTYLIYIGEIIEQVSRDFSSIEEDGTPSLQSKLTYSGSFELASFAKDTIISNTESFQYECIEHPTNRALNIAPMPTNNTFNSSFIIRVMQHPASPIIGVILFLSGVALITSSTAISLGLCMTAAGAIIIAGYAATKCGFFSERRNTPPENFIAPNNNTLPVL